MSKKTIYILSGSAIILVVALLALSKMGVIGSQKKGTEVDIALVNEMTIIETVSATGKIQPEIEVKNDVIRKISEQVEKILAHREIA